MNDFQINLAIEYNDYPLPREIKLNLALWKIFLYSTGKESKQTLNKEKAGVLVDDIYDHEGYEIDELSFLWNDSFQSYDFSIKWQTHDLFR